MADRSENSSGITGGYNVSVNKALIAQLKANMVSGGVIAAQDFNDLVSLWNQFSGHSHTILDVYGIHDFGNTNPPGYGGPPLGSYQMDQSNGPNLSGGVGGVGQGWVLAASQPNALVNVMAGSGNHNHPWPDRTS